MEYINVNNLTKDYGNGRGIFNFNFNVKKGEVHAIVGQNGSGKTTTLRLFMGFLKPDSGDVSINGLDSWNESQDIKRIVSYVPGEINFPDVGSGETFLDILKGYYGIKDSTYMNKLIDLFKLDARVPLRRMSKGMKQKAALVAAFMKDADIILLDEPSTGLDPLMRDNLIELINMEKKRGKTIVMSSHIFTEIEQTSDRVTFINNGKLIETIDLHELLDSNVKEYKVSFESNEESIKFVQTTKLNVDKIEIDSVSVMVNDDLINEFFDELSNYKIKSIDYKPYTLEKYYDQEILGGIINE